VASRMPGGVSLVVSLKRIRARIHLSCLSRPWPGQASPVVKPHPPTGLLRSLSATRTPRLRSRLRQALPRPQSRYKSQCSGGRCRTSLGKILNLRARRGTSRVTRRALDTRRTTTPRQAPRMSSRIAGPQGGWCREETAMPRIAQDLRMPPVMSSEAVHGPSAHRKRMKITRSS
jgi:hypothetical protein